MKRWFAAKPVEVPTLIGEEMKIQATIALAAFAVLIEVASLPAQAQQSTPKFAKALESDVTVINVRTLSGGNSLTSEKDLKFYRDTDGSTRLEAGNRVTIIDKQAHKLYVLNLQDRTAQEIDQPEAALPNNVTRRHSVSLNSLSDGIDLSPDTPTPALKTLAPIIVEGFSANGQEVSSTVPAHSAAGNALPLTRTVQTWHSRDLSLPLKTVISDPIGGTTTSTYKNIKVGQHLDRALFSIPDNFIRTQSTVPVIHRQPQ
jgi:outer membrane lipoprotein-sorting protein